MQIKSAVILALALNTLTVYSVWAAEKLVFAVDIIRHGDRTPFTEISGAPHHWAEGLGELTAQGMQQEYQLGKNLRQKYVYQYHLLPKNYVPETIYVRSSDTDRTLMSAESLLLGLYPLGTGPNLSCLRQPALPGGYQPIPIHTIAQDKDTLLKPKASNDFTNLLQKHVFSTAEWKAKNAELQPKFAAWSAATGVPITDLTDLKSVGDVLFIYQLHNIPLPPGLTSEDAKEIIDARHWGMLAIFKNQLVASAMGHDLFKTIVEQMQQASENKTSRKYVLYSAHDTTILAQLGILGAVDKIPKYASDLNFSLFNIDDQYYVKVTFNDRPVFISACGSTMCSLTQFAELDPITP